VIWLRILAFGGGAVLALWTVASAIRTTVLPRSARVAITAWTLRFMRGVFRAWAARTSSFPVRDRVLAFYGPTTLILLPIVWLVLIGLAYTTMFWSLAPTSWSAAVSLSGSSLTTLGFVAAASLPERILAFTEAGWGLILVALMITYLPTIYSTFSRREAQVALLEVRAGDPPTAVEMLVRHHRIGWIDDMTATWLDWERWFAELEESHTTFPILAFFRSPQPQRSWVTASGTVLDAASLYVACYQGAVAPARVCVRSGYLALRTIADFFGIEFDPDPQPTDPISISRGEFDEVWDRMEGAGLRLHGDRDAAWAAYAGWRVNYDAVLLSLAEITMAPYAPWTSDRSAPTHREPKVRRFGIRRRPRRADRRDRQPS
jgi:hypothetical protein